MMFARLPRPAHGPASAALRAVACFSAVAAAVTLAACSSPTSRFYTLSATDAPATARSAANPALLIEVPPVDVPPQVAKNQMVVQTGPTQVKVLEEERWASLPGDEIRRALSSNLTAQLGAIDVYGFPPRPSETTGAGSSGAGSGTSLSGASATGAEYCFCPDLLRSPAAHCARLRRLPARLGTALAARCSTLCLGQPNSPRATRRCVSASQTQPIRLNCDSGRNTLASLAAMSWALTPFGFLKPSAPTTLSSVTLLPETNRNLPVLSFDRSLTM